jgi:enoyl-[acyl-carrier protein] reductase II
VTGRINGSPTRILKNRMARDYIRLERQGADRMELEKYTLGSLRKAVFDGNVDEGSLMAGQDCGQLKEIRPLKEIFRSLAEEASAVIRKQQETLRCLGGFES